MILLKIAAISAILFLFIKIRAWDLDYESVDKLAKALGVVFVVSLIFSIISL